MFRKPLRWDRVGKERRLCVIVLPGGDKREFERMRESAIAERGLVMPGLADKEEESERVRRHDFRGSGKDIINKQKYGVKKI